MVAFSMACLVISDRGFFRSLDDFGIDPQAGKLRVKVYFRCEGGKGCALLLI